MSVTLNTSFGPIKIELYCKEAPKSCKNFLALSAANKYDGVKFHRLIPGFIIQGGKTDCDSIYGGTFDDEFDASLKHDTRGVVSMASSGPNTNKTQFFITLDHQPLTHLNNSNTIIGKVIYGFETLDKMEACEIDAKNRPLNPIVISDVEIHANPFAN